MVMEPTQEAGTPESVREVRVRLARPSWLNLVRTVPSGAGGW
ncbi:MAG: hypothetical protein ACRDSL_24050 [Pseudonocardiaceae bacterium]